MEQGASLKVIQERLGHSNLSTTLNIYLHRSPHIQQQAIDDFDAAYRKAAKKKNEQAAKQKKKAKTDEK